MKKNDWFILIATSAYTFLFYEQSPGINFFLFSILLTTLCLIRNAQLIKDFSWLTIATGTLVSGFSVFYFGTPLTVYANILSLFLLAAFSFNSQTSLFISLFNSFYSLLWSIPLFITNLTNIDRTNETATPSKAKRFLLFLLPLFVAVIFFMLYRASNPLFEKITDQINFDFISVEWIIFTAFGFVLMYGFFYHKFVKKFTDADHGNSDTLSFISEEKHQSSWVASIISKSNELFTGVTLFVLLNLLLFSVNGIDIYYLYIIQHLPDDLTLSQYLHDGANALIFSIVLAIAIILFYFRGRLNFLENNKILKGLTYLWIAQNVFLIVTTAKRNFFYVSDFGLTHKRIGVYIFLALCIIGLLTAFIKVLKVKSSWFLFRKNTWIWYLTLVLATIINWDALIARHNLNLAEKKNIAADYFYLGDLSYTSLSTLFEFYVAEKKNSVDSKTFDSYFLSLMKSKYRVLSNNVEGADWQSSCLLEFKSKKEIEELMKDDPFFFPKTN